MLEGPRFHSPFKSSVVNGGFGLGDTNENMSFYHKIGEGSNMSLNSYNSQQTSNYNGSLAMSIDSSVGSNESQTVILKHAAHHSPISANYSAENSVYHPDKLPGMSNCTALAYGLMDPRYPTEMLQGYEEWTLDLRKLEIGKAFAQGSFGMLYRGTYNGEEVAIKLLEKPDNDHERAQLMEHQFVQEVKMLATLRHPNIVRFLGACKKHMVYCIVTEYAKGGSLRQFLTKRQKSQHKLIPLKLAVQQALDVARGMAYVHGLGFIHRDLKSDNLLIGADKSIKIADFGVARIEVRPEGMTPETGTYRWMAPEMIQHRPYNQKVDVYSFGIVMWELVTGMLPFAKMTAVQAAFAVVNRNARPVIPYDCLPILGDIMTRCWDVNPDVRPTFSEVVEILEFAQREILGTARKARFRCCISEPKTTE